MVGRYPEQEKGHKTIWKCFGDELSGILALDYCFYMKKRIIGTLILMAACLFNCTAPSPENKREEVARPVINDLPNMIITLADGSELNLKKLKGKQS